jgi:hypothetical protein
MKKLIGHETEQFLDYAAAARTLTFFSAAEFLWITLSCAAARHSDIKCPKSWKK